MKELSFTKAHACGNDFLVVPLDSASTQEQERQLAIELCARTTSIGADGVEFLQWTGENSATIRLRNADGSIAEISGNGTRCVAAHMAAEKGLTPGAKLTIQTDAGPRECEIIASPEDASQAPTYQIRSTMGTPTVALRTIHLRDLELHIEGAVVNTGNPHFVIFTDDETFTLHGLSWQQLGKAICFHPDFPGQTNVEFVHVRSQNEIAIRIYERGVGPTTSSGTGTCATSSAAMVLRNCATTLQVEAPGGTQLTEWPTPTSEMLLTGPATIICSGHAYPQQAQAYPEAK